MKDLINWIENYYKECGHSKETTESIISDIEEALLDQAIKVDIDIIADDQDYEN